MKRCELASEDKRRAKRQDSQGRKFSLRRARLQHSSVARLQIQKYFSEVLGFPHPKLQCKHPVDVPDGIAFAGAEMHESYITKGALTPVGPWNSEHEYLDFSR
jgi:hypothetical protein